MNKIKIDLDNNLIFRSENIEYKNDNLKNYLDGQIIESGSNSNGNYIKYANGILICTKNLTGTTGKFDLWANSTYYMDIQNGDWPLSFAKLDNIQVTNAHNQMWCCCSNHSLVSAGVTRLLRPDNGGSGQNYNINIMGIGRWK